jgi:NADP-dependent 3-hydroxy acid dehydrogenase YdfG
MTAHNLKNVLITGASSGLGRELCKWFAARGSKVWATGRRIEALNALAQEIGDNALTPVKMDVTKHEKTVEQIRAIDQACGGLDVVVANAGISFETYAPDLKWEQVEQTLMTNVMGAAATLSAVAPAMVKRGRGRLVGVSSLAAWRGFPRTAAYSASKAFLEVFLEGLRVDLVGTGVKVSCINPGFVKSEMTSKLAHKLPFLMETDAAVDRMGKAIVRGASQASFPWQLSVPLRLVRFIPPAIYDAAANRLDFRRARA